MPLRILNNIPSINARRIGNINNRNLGVRLERLSSGLRINRAADDASGLTVSEGMRAEIGGLRQGARSAEQAINLVQTAEGALHEVSGMLLRMRELAVQSASSTVSDGNRESINAEFVQLINEIDRIASATSYNNTSLLTGYGKEVDLDIATSTALDSATTGVVDVHLSSAASGTYTFIDDDDTDSQITLGNGVATQTVDLGPALDFDDATGGVVVTGSAVVAQFDRLGIQLILSGQRDAQGTDPDISAYRDGGLDGETLVVSDGAGGVFQVGPDAKASDRIEVSIGDVRSSGAHLNIDSLSVSTLSASQSAISALDLAIGKVSQSRGDLGAFQNRLDYGLRAVENALEQNQASESSIRDADIAHEVSEFTRAQILVQSTTAMMSQSNVLPQSALTLLQ